MNERFSFIKEQLNRKILLTNIESCARTDKTSKTYLLVAIVRYLVATP